VQRVTPDAAPRATGHETVTRIQDRSDYRIKLHRQCAEDDFREHNLEKCERLAREVDDAVRDSVQDEIRRDSDSHDGDTSLAPVVVARRMQQS
jgi:hypothetical protein